VRVFAALLDAAYALARPALFRLDPEQAHALALACLAAATSDPRLALAVRRRLLVQKPVEAFGLRFANPIGLAAGLDKNGLALNGWAALGFGHVEVGTVTPRAQAGNPRPRVFRLPADRALINRMGFSNDGAAAVAARLRVRPPGLVVGGNIGKGRDTPLEAALDDYLAAASVLAPVVDYLTINVSSPNTPGLRLLQTPDHLASSVRELRTAARRPVLVKLAPDLDLDILPELVAAVREAGAAGLIATNTTTSRLGLRYPSPQAVEPGGLSGPPVACLAQAFTARLADLAAPDLTVISAGGVSSATDVQARLTAGARLVQVYTSLIYEGPALVARLLTPNTGSPAPKTHSL
jgi:dihydroorotate dehydrogenase